MDNLFNVDGIIWECSRIGLAYFMRYVKYLLIGSLSVRIFFTTGSHERKISADLYENIAHSSCNFE